MALCVPPEPVCSCRGEGRGRGCFSRGNNAVKSRNGSFKHIPAPLARHPCSWRKALGKSYSLSDLSQTQRVAGFFSGFPACPKKAAWMEQFVLGDGAAGEGGMWLQDGKQVALQAWGAAWACCLVRSVPVLCCASCSYAGSFQMVEISVLK